MKSNGPNFCGLDLQKDTISIVQFSARENAATNLFLLPFFPDADNDFWQLWQKALSTLKTDPKFKTLPGYIVCGLPSEYAHIMHCLIDEDEKNWREAVLWEANQQLIGASDEYVIDYELAAGGGSKKYLAVAYRKSLVDRTVGILRKVKIAPRIIDLDIFGLINAFEANYPEKLSDVSLLVHTEKNLTKLVLTGNGAFLDFDTFEHSDEETFHRVLGEKIGNFLAAPEGMMADPIVKVYLAGSYFSPEARREPVLETVRDAEMLNPFRKVQCQVAIDEQHLDEISPQLAVAVGLALRGRE